MEPLGSGATLEEVCHWGVDFEGLEASNAALAVLCFLRADKNVISQFPAPATMLLRPVAMSSPPQGLYLSEVVKVTTSLLKLLSVYGVLARQQKGNQSRHRVPSLRHLSSLGCFALV